MKKWLLIILPVLAVFLLAAEPTYFPEGSQGRASDNEARLLHKILGAIRDHSTATSTTALPAGENHIGEVGGRNTLVSASFTRPADTTAYASGDLVANSTTAGSVAPMTLTIGRTASGSGSTGMIRRLRLRKSGTSITNASFRVHFYRVSPTVTNGDNGAWLSNNAANYVGHIDVTFDKAFSDGAAGNGVPAVGTEINFTSQNYYALVEARGAYTPANAEVFTVAAEVLQN